MAPILDPFLTRRRGSARESRLRLVGAEPRGTGDPGDEGVQASRILVLDGGGEAAEPQPNPSGTSRRNAVRRRIPVRDGRRSGLDIGGTENTEKPPELDSKAGPRVRSVGMFGTATTLGAVILVSLVGVLWACASGVQPPPTNGSPEESDAVHSRRRALMVATQIEPRGIGDPAVLGALSRVPRERFVPPELAEHAYTDRPLPIGHGQTISQPYIVALMTEAARPRSGMKVLEIGTGCGYQAAVLAEIVDEVFTIEIVAELGETARRNLGETGYSNVRQRIGDGFAGWSEEAPFDAILVTAAPPEIPPPLLAQLAVGGRLVIPVGGDRQELVVVTRTAEGFSRRELIPVRFVPMTGRAQEEP